MYTYLLINLFSILIPFAASFDKRLDFYKQWRFLFPAIFVTLAFFISWDVLFTYLGVWGFNERYLTGIDVINLPLEEWLFFISIPYACVFTYTSLNYLIKKDYFKNHAGSISWILIVILLVVGLINYNRIYTSVTFLATALFLLIHLYVFKSNYLGRFYFSYMIILIPFLIVNGILTGSFIEEQVVWYDNTQNLGIRIFTIPIEDSVYGLLLILMNVTLFEALKSNYLKRQKTT
ncbi:MAG: lycopene cyclase domain-containing protein [Bacteroidales bacterium]